MVRVISVGYGRTYRRPRLYGALRARCRSRATHHLEKETDDSDPNSVF